ncbi:MAG TPA: sensor histidine kinase [Clostridiales bacterium]|nr:sensor histidine kinase [Clostridiales bacterium]
MKWKILPLKNIIMYLIGTLAVSILIICLYSVHSYYELLIGTIKSNQELYSRQVLQSTEKNLNDIQNIALSVAYNQSVQRYLMETDTGKKFALYQQVINLLNNTKSLNNSILDIGLIGETGNFANLVGDMNLYHSRYEESSRADSSTIHFLDKSTILVDSSLYDCQVAAFPICKLSTTSSQFIGVLFITINPTTILGDNLFDNSFVPTDLMFVNSNRQLIVGDEELYGEIEKKLPLSDNFNISYNNQTYICRRFHVDIADGTIYTLVNQSSYNKKIINMLLPQYLLILVVFLVILIIFLAFMKTIMNSFRQLMNIMNKISTGKRKALKERITIDSQKNVCLEIYLIANSFNDMMDEITNLNHDIFGSYTKMYELEMNKRKAEIAYLRSQINPHFLYNTLTLICGMASENNSEGIIGITHALSRIYRYSIGNDIVTVRQELEIVKAYVMIQMTRFEDRFTVDYDITDDVLDALIPRMIIQPLVENAVKHGLEKCLRKGNLTIGGRKNYKDNTLVLWIYDTGVGMTTEQLAALRQALSEATQRNIGDGVNSHIYETENSIGLSNVNSRIALYYGDPYRLHIDSEENIGTNIQIKIPFTTN